MFPIWDSLQQHRDDQISVECPECNVKFKKDHLSQHVAFVHHYTDNDSSGLLERVESEEPVEAVEAAEMPFKCEQCPSSFRRKRELNTHLKKEHPTIKQPNDPMPSTSSSTNGFVCAGEGCDFIIGDHEEFVAHCAAAHKEQTNQEFKIFEMCFDNIDDFFVRCVLFLSRRLMLTRMLS